MRNNLKTRILGSIFFLLSLAIAVGVLGIIVGGGLQGNLALVVAGIALGVVFAVPVFIMFVMGLEMMME